MIELHQYPANPRTINFSPFCLKLETHLRLAGIPFKTVAQISTSRNRKGKMPYIVDDQAVIADSQLVVEYLTRKLGKGKDLDAHLTPGERAQARALRRMLEEAFVFCLLYSHWIDDESWPKFREALFAAMPAPVRAVIPAMARRGMRKALHEQGTGRHSPGEIYAMGKADLDSLAVQLGGQAYFFGDQPSAFDAVAFGFLNNLVHGVTGSPLQKHAQAHAPFAAFCERVHQRCYTGAGAT